MGEDLLDKALVSAYAVDPKNIDQFIEAILNDSKRYSDLFPKVAETIADFRPLDPGNEGKDKYLTLALRLAPDNAELWLKRSLVYLDANKVEKRYNQKLWMKRG
jgi:hypothetical protein